MTAMPDNGYCNVTLVFHVNEGHYGDADLAGLNVIMIARTTAPMVEGNWTAAVYLDERACAQQQESLAAIFGGAAGGPPGTATRLLGWEPACCSYGGRAPLGPDPREAGMPLGARASRRRSI
jgi:hypothetical protein